MKKLAMYYRPCFATVLLVLVSATWGSAHEGPHEVIDRLTATITTDGLTADRLFRRGVEYRALRKYRSAAADFKHALQLEPQSDFIRLELVRLQLKQFEVVLVAAGDTAGMKTVAAGLLNRVEPLLGSSEEAVRAAGHAIRGQVFRHTQRWQLAVEEFDAALENHPQELQWVLWRAEAEQQLERWDAAVAGLRQASAATDSPVIQAALCDALLAAARPALDTDPAVAAAALEEAQAMIDQQLLRCRLKSRWRIRKADCVLMLGDEAEAKTQLVAAIDELDARLNTDHPDPILVRDRQKAQRLMPN